MKHLERPTDEEEYVASHIVDAAYKVHKTLGPGLLENVYEICFCHELEKQNMVCKRQVSVPIEYDGIRFQEALRLDVLVDDLVVCEIKAADKMNPVWEAQLLTYLRLTQKRLGFLINFNLPLAKHGIKRIIL
jgi:GxxExxY protein